MRSHKSEENKRRKREENMGAPTKNAEMQVHMLQICTKGGNHAQGMQKCSIYAPTSSLASLGA